MQVVVHSGGDPVWLCVSHMEGADDGASSALACGGIVVSALSRGGWPRGMITHGGTPVAVLICSGYTTGEGFSHPMGCGEGEVVVEGGGGRWGPVRRSRRTPPWRGGGASGAA